MTDSSLKRFKSSTSSAAARAITFWPALLQLIACYIPSDHDVELGVAKQHVVLQTISSLCRAIPNASHSLSSANESCWRRLVLSHFDFTVDPNGYNIEDSMDVICRENLPNEFCAEEEDDEDPADWAKWCRHPFKAEMDEWTNANSNASWCHFFVEDFLEWISFGVRFRPSQYAFLKQIQVDESLMETKWPESESAFSLFSDLVVLQTLVRTDGGFETDSDEKQLLMPVLLRRLESDVTEGIDFRMLKLCGFIPPCCSPVPTVVVDEERSYDGVATSEDTYIFPRSNTPNFVKLRHLVHGKMNDWRRIHVHYEEASGPVFYVGRSKTSGRWLGFVGESDFIRHMWHPHDATA